MALREVTVEAQNIKEGLKKACRQFSSEYGDDPDIDQLEYEVLKKTSRFLGLGRKTYRIRVRWPSKEDEERELEQALSSAQSQDRNIDGICRLSFHTNGVFLTVYPPQGDGQRVSREEVTEKIAEYEIEDPDMETVENAVLKAEGKPVKIAERRPKLDRDGEIKLQIAKDQMSAAVVIHPARGGRQVDLDLVKETLEGAGIEFGIDLGPVKKAIAEKSFDETIPVASGRKPVEGIDAEIKYCFDPETKLAPAIQKDGTVDHRRLTEIQTVEEGELLAKRVPPQPGVAGTNIFGEEVSPPPARDRNIKVGKNVRLDEGKQKAYSEIKGKASLTDGRISVLPIYEVNGDVDYGVGNLDFVGHIVVHGNVQPGFTVEAGGDIEIMGSIEACELKAGGDIVIKNGLQGQNKGKVYAEGDLQTRFIENCQVEVLGDIVVQDAIMHSRVYAGGSIRLEGVKGVIVGGELQAFKEISARTVGSHLATRTELKVGVSPAVRTELCELREEIIQLEEKLNKTQKAVELLENMERKDGSLSPEKQKMFDQLLTTSEHINIKLKEQKKKCQEFEQEERQGERGKIRIEGKVHPGTVITIGKISKPLKDEHQHIVFYLDDGEIRSRNFE